MNVSPASAAQADAAACHAGTENTLGPSNSKGVEPAANKAETTAGSSATQQRIEKPHEVISFEAAKEVRSRLIKADLPVQSGKLVDI